MPDPKVETLRRLIVAALGKPEDELDFADCHAALCWLDTEGYLDAPLFPGPPCPECGGEREVLHRWAEPPLEPDEDGRIVEEMIPCPDCADAPTRIVTEEALLAADDALIRTWIAETQTETTVQEYEREGISEDGASAVRAGTLAVLTALLGRVEVAQEVYECYGFRSVGIQVGDRDAVIVGTKPGDRIAVLRRKENDDA